MKTSKMNIFFVSLLCFNLSLINNKNDYSDMVTKDTVNIISQSMYNQYLSMCQNEVYIDGYYAPYYFKNLVTNFPTNSHDSCNYTALSMMLSFYDSYMNDNIVPSSYESLANFTNFNNVYDVYSPGVISEPTSLSNVSMSEYNSYINSSYSYDLQSYLIKISKDYGINTSSSLGLNLNQIENLANQYLSIMNSTQTYSFNVITNYDDNVDALSFAKHYIKQGLPVLLRVGSGTSTNGHTVIAYDYNESLDEIYAHMGWKKNGSALTKVPLHNTIYNIYYDALVIAPISTHHHTNNYKIATSLFCPCKLMYNPVNINVNSSTNYIDKTPIYKWDSLYQERWLSSTNFNYNINIKDTNNNIITSYQTNKNYFRISRKADWQEIVENHEEYKIEVEFNYSGAENYLDFINIQEFNSPSSFIENPYLDSSNINLISSSYDLVKSIDYTVNNNDFSVDYLDASYDEINENVTLSCINSNNSTTGMFFEFENSITRMDVDLSVYEDSSLDLIKGNYRIRIYKYDENNNPVYVSSVVENIDNSLLEELPIGVNNKERVTIYFNEPLNNFEFRVEYLGSNPLSLGKIVVGDMYFYNYDNTNILPLSGYELEYDPDYWNNTYIETVGNHIYYLKDFSVCYSYAINNTCVPETNELYDKQILGEYYGQKYNNFEYTKENMEFLIKADYQKYNEDYNAGLYCEEVSRYERCPIGTYKIALVIDNIYPIRDVHWLRQNKDGTWSQKFGGTDVINVDFSNNLIYDPAYCDNNNENDKDLEFICYFAITPWNWLYEPE